MSTYSCLRTGASVVLVIAAFGLSAAQAGMISIDLDSSRSVVAIDQPMRVTVSATTDQDIAAFGFHLDYDDSLLRLDTVVVEPPFLPIHLPDAALAEVTGYLPFGASQGPNPVLLATLTFTARASGKPSVSIGVTPDDPMEGFVPLTPPDPNGGQGGGTGGGEGGGGEGGGLGGDDVVKIVPTIITPVEVTTGSGDEGGPTALPEPMTLLFLAGGLLVVRGGRRVR